MIFSDGNNPGQNCSFQNWNAVQIILFSWAGENPAAVLELTAREDQLIRVHHVHWLCLGGEGMILSAWNPAWNPFPIGVTGGWTLKHRRCWYYINIDCCKGFWTGLQPLPASLGGAELTCLKQALKAQQSGLKTLKRHSYLRLSTGSVGWLPFPLLRLSLS